VFQILGEIDGGHSSFAESTLDAIPAGKGSGKALSDFSHALRRSVCSVTLPAAPGELVGDENSLRTRTRVPIHRAKVRLANKGRQTPRATGSTVPTPSRRSSSLDEVRRAISLRIPLRRERGRSKSSQLEVEAEYSALKLQRAMKPNPWQPRSYRGEHHLSAN
jgi:hypothetical protein